MPDEPEDPVLKMLFRIDEHLQQFTALLRENTDQLKLLSARVGSLETRLSAMELAVRVRGSR